MKENANILGAELDAFDRHILSIVQQNSHQTHSEIGEKIGLSSSAVRRRLNALRDNNVIEKEVAILSQNATGVRLIITITFQNESIEAFDALDRQIRDTPEVLQGYHVSGPEDYILIVHGPSLSWYEDWSKQAFMSNPAIRRYDTRVVWSCKKFETAIPLELKDSH